MTSAFDNLCGVGKPLKAEPPDAKEFAGLVRERSVTDLIVACDAVAAGVGALASIGVRGQQPE